MEKPIRQINLSVLVPLPDGGSLPSILHNVQGNVARLAWPFPLTIPSFVLHLTYCGRVRRLCKTLQRGEAWLDVEMERMGNTLYLTEAVTLL